MSTKSASVAVFPRLSDRDRLFISRFSYGHNLALASAVSKAGGGRAWFEKQLAPSAVSDPDVAQLKGWFPNVWYSPLQLWNRNDSGVAPYWEVMADLGRWTMMQRIFSTRQLNEVMTEFWSNLFNIPLADDSAWPYRVAYDGMIRKNALLKYDDMLVKVITHPCMGLYLDNAISTKDAPNENLGRELLELHSVGVDAGYTEDEVKASARMLTGYRVDLYYPEFKAYYDPSVHDTHRVTVLGFTHRNGKADGRAATEAYIRYLAHHPATAKRIARRLCVRFVHDNPSADLVRTVARAWTRSGTDIKATLRALVAHPEFASSAGQKVRTPLEDTLAAIRALGIKPTKPTQDNSFANALYWVVSDQGMAPYDWPQPNGYPETNLPWSSAGRALDSFDVHRSLGARWWPTDQARFPSYKSWLPALPATFDKVVSHVSKQVLGVAAGSKIKAGLATKTGIALSHSVTASDLDDSTMAQILVGLLDTPAHMTR